MSGDGDLEEEGVGQGRMGQGNGRIASLRWSQEKVQAVHGAYAKEAWCLPHSSPSVPCLSGDRGRVLSELLGGSVWISVLTSQMALGR